MNLISTESITRLSSLPGAHQLVEHTETAQVKQVLQTFREMEISQALPEFQFLLDFANRTRGGIALSVLQHDHVLALEHGLKLLDLVNVDDYRAADAQESLRGEMGFQRTHGLAQDMILLADMHDSVFSGGLDRLDLVQLHKGNLAWGFDSQSSALPCRCRRLT